MKASIIIILGFISFQSFGQELSSISFVPRLAVEYIAGLDYKSKLTLDGCSIQPGSGISNCTKRALTQFLKEYISYPSYAEQTDFSAQCKVKFMVDRNGKSNEIKISNCHKIYVHQIAKALDKTHWYPATKGGKPYDFQVELNIDFK